VVSVARALNAFWFREGSATRLAALRLVIGTTALVFLWTRIRQYASIAGTSADLFDPVGPVVLLSGPIPPPIYEAIMIGAVVAGLAFVLGVQFRWTGPLFAALLLWIVSYRNSWSMIYHVDNLLVMHVLVLGLTRSADALSVDSLGGRSRAGVWRRVVAEAHGLIRPPPARAGWHWEYGYPVRLLCAVTVAVYVLSATAKLVGPFGLSWALGEGLRSQVGFDALRKELLEGGTSPFAYVVFNNLALAATLGIGTIVVEAGAIAALFDVRIGRVWAALAYGFHVGISFVMGIVFWYQLIGVAFTPFWIGEGVVRRCRAEVLRWVRAFTPVPPFAEAATAPAPEHRLPGDVPAPS
jgi:hypothetical protein